MYHEKKLLNTKIGNNAFAWEERILKYGNTPTLTIPSIIHGTIDDAKIGKDVVFEEMEDGILRSCIGLQNFVKLGSLENDDKKGTQVGLGRETVGARGKQELRGAERMSFSLPNSFGTFSTKSTSGILSENPKITIFDNHNHALYFWIEAIRNGTITPGFELIHIDEHSDLWDNENKLHLEESIKNPEYAWNFVNHSCNVGNYILPAIECGLINNMIRIENEYQIDTYMDYIPIENSVLNLDLDIFATELDHIPENKKMSVITNLLKKVKYVTIATSPFFIDQGIALSKLHKIMNIYKQTS